jgi:hypothetical protein
MIRVFWGVILLLLRQRCSGVLHPLHALRCVVLCCAVHRWTAVTALLALDAALVGENQPWQLKPVVESPVCAL